MSDDYETQEYDDCEVRIFKDAASLMAHLKNGGLEEDKPLTIRESIKKEWPW